MVATLYNTLRYSILLIGLFILAMVITGCSEESTSYVLESDCGMQNIVLSYSEIIEKFKTEYVQMAEREIAIDADSATYAQYALPTDRYKHGALGDYWEASQLVVYQNGQMHTFTLDEMFVFEDIRPRLFDVDNDSSPEIITIRSKIGEGAGIAIYKISQNGLEEYAFVDEIGTPNRWLNIAAIHNMDSDGTIEIIWVETPHIGGILKGAKITKGEIVASDALTYYSNHEGGLHNLCLSVVTFENDLNICFVPTQNRNTMVGFSFINGAFQKQHEINQQVDFSLPLLLQYPFCNVVSNHVNCITSE